MFKKIYHQLNRYINNEVEWVGSDQYRRYLDNIETNYDKLKEHDWIDKKFTYKFNSHGFRCDEFTEDDSIMFLGCSMTMGIGLPLEDTWPTKVAENLNLKCVNLGLAGTGPDTAFRLANHYISQIKPKIIVYLDPPFGRFTLLTGNNQFHSFLVNNMEDIDPMFIKYYEHWISLSENLILDSKKHMLAIESLCRQNNVKFLFLYNRELELLDYARDLMHHGRKSNLEFSKLVLDRIYNDNFN